MVKGPLTVALSSVGLGASPPTGPVNYVDKNSSPRSDEKDTTNITVVVSQGPTSCEHILVSFRHCPF